VPDRRRLEALGGQERDAFLERIPRSAELVGQARAHQPCGVPMAWMAGLYRHPPLYVVEGFGAHFVDADGNRYLDMNQADLFATLGFAPPPVVEAVSRRLAKGSAFLLPVEEGLEACRLLAERSRLPFWQFSGSASAANTEAMRLARLATGRDRVVMFDGKYHGHLDESLGSDGGYLGLPKAAGAAVRQIPFNDLEALRRALAPGDVAALVAEPLLTNCNLVFPDEGFWAEASGLCRAAGALLIVDEAHSHSFAYGGLTRAWGLPADIQVLGKGIGSGIPFAAYGVSEALGQLMEESLDVDIGTLHSPSAHGLATGGTTYANPLALVAAAAALSACLREEDYARTERLGMALAEGLDALFQRRGLPWRAPQIGGRSGWVLFPELPRTAAEAAGSLDPRFVETRRHYMANRGIWEAVASAGPACSFMHSAQDVARYLEVAEDFLKAILD